MSWSPLRSPHVPRHHGQPPRHRGPAYERRQQRRQAAHAAAEQAQSCAVQVRDVPHSGHATPADEAGEVVTADQAISDENVVSVDEKSAEKAGNDFKCLLCDFTSNWENGLQIHMTRKHNTIEQIDGNSTFDGEETQDDKQYSGTQYYWKTGRLGTVFQSFLDANEIIENSNFETETKNQEKEKILEARKSAFGDDFRYFPPWN